MPGTRRKPIERLAPRSPAKVLQLPPSPSFKRAPRVPAGITSARAVDAWRAFWHSPMANFVQPCDLYALERWVEHIDDAERLREELAGQEVINDPKGPRKHPLVTVIRWHESAAESIAEQFGMNPRSRFRLGVAYAAVERSASKLRAAEEEAGKAKPAPAATEVIDLDELT